jgi:hemerythrin-like domain-containing protein
MSVTSYLMEQHRAIDALFGRLERATDGDQRALLVRQLADQLAAHMVIEEDLFYPAARDAIDDAEEIEESVEEHELARVALRRVVDSLAPGGDAFAVRLRVLRQLVEQHVDHEESALFPAVEGAIDGDIKENLLAQLRVLHGNAMEAGFEQVTSPGAETPEEPRASSPRPVLRGDSARN